MTQLYITLQPPTDTIKYLQHYKQGNLNSNHFAGEMSSCKKIKIYGNLEVLQPIWLPEAKFSVVDVILWGTILPPLLPEVFILRLSNFTRGLTFQKNKIAHIYPRSSWTP